MNFELYVPGEPLIRFASEKEAVEAAEKALRKRPHAEVDLIDAGTGKPVENRAWRARLRDKLGF